MKKKIAIISLIILTFALLVSGCGQSPSQPQGTQEISQSTLRVGLVPNQAPDKIKAQYEPFRQFLSDTLDMPVELFVASDYAGVVEAMANDKLDVAYFGGLTYAQAKQRAKIHPIVTEIDEETQTSKYYSLIIVPADSPVQSTADLKGKVFAFGDISSTSGSLYPRFMLDKAGIKVPGDLENVVYSGGHDATAQAVQNGTVDAGGIEGRILNRLITNKTVDASKIRIIEKHLVEGYPWVVRDSIDKSLEEKIVNSFLEMKDSELLTLMRAKSFTKVTDSNYTEIEKEANRLGLINPNK
ncbi:phosphate/phosphite/phosphonate ABC transporter substrate-binding protein [Desulfosporosinus sp.]|uniref:phosphate/phosphite/phosphonate ABC transporter substrate-binding protein n=1 Tax=Desulfosporosinus sp. TaxID=157907 RepID=UPI002313A83C|nr:phosphate/phosphite/phosphonate ABC transporter substrate-binding protein [Desulfosporosinus sp.]MCO5384411.1 phosphate/phosphite/phosphonate ABC transporter substrate-binding protein [Desulfosporosinus sp.]MDA8221770.1 phosphate/phosphite/phosphonate ABC transporter substrate-binding protein [Desulfitobacterium hafniense]